MTGLRSNALLALLLPMTVVGAAIVYVVTGSVLFAIVFAVVDVVPIAVLLNLQAKARRETAGAAQARLSRYSDIRDS